jgi:proteasome lid subunit RPN8/RPN11
MTLILQPNQLAQIRTHAEDAYPEECCGLLLGTWNVEHDQRSVHAVLPKTNQWTIEVSSFTETDSEIDSASSTVSKHSRYWIDPKDLMEAQRYGRDRGWVILGVYHSHPDAPAVPSERDRQLAWMEYSYPIVSVVDGDVAAVKSWRLGDEGHYQPEAIATEAPSAAP